MRRPNLSCLALAVSLLSACSKPSDGKTHITYWEKWSSAEAVAMQAVVDQFNHSQDRIVGFPDPANVDRRTTARPAILRAE